MAVPADGDDVVNWDYRKQLFWRGATRYSALFAGLLLFAGVITGTGTVLALGVCFAVLTLTFGRRIR